MDEDLMIAGFELLKAIDSKGKVNSVRFTLPSMPVSVNSLYQIIYSQRRVELKPEARRWKTEAKGRMPQWEHSHNALIQVDAIFEYPRFYKNGKPRIHDVSNLLKLLIDAIAEKYGFDDCFVWAGSWSSRDSKDERVIVTVSEYWLNDGELEIRKGEQP